MKQVWDSFVNAFTMIGGISVMDVIDILIVAALLYLLITLIRRTKTHKVFQGILILVIVLWLSGEFQLHTVNYILRNTLQIGLLALVVLFQPEIRRFLEKLGTGGSFLSMLTAVHTQTTEAAITQTVLACSAMSASKTGALIVFERGNRLDDEIRTGTVIDAEMTAELLKNLFYDKAPLHDGAVIVRNGRLQAAGCMLPLSSNANLSRELGMRHRAGIGMSEASDAVVVIVSEETGSISVATEGMLKRHLAKETFEMLLRNELEVEEEEKRAPRLSLSRLRRKKNEK